MTILTVGHSNRAIAEFIELLVAHAIARLVDIRTVPRSRHNPQFGRDSLPGSLQFTSFARVDGHRVTYPGVV